MGKIPAFISNGLWLLLKNLLVFFQVPLSQHLGKLSWKISVYHSGCLGNNFMTLCFSSALRLWKVAAPENEAQKGLIHGENIHLFHRRPRWQGAHSQTLHRCLAVSVVEALRQPCPSLPRVGDLFHTPLQARPPCEWEHRTQCARLPQGFYHWHS